MCWNQLSTSVDRRGVSNAAGEIGVFSVDISSQTCFLSEMAKVAYTHSLLK